MTNFTQVFQPMPSWINWPISLNGPDLTSSPDKYYSLDSEDDLFFFFFFFFWRWLLLRLSKRLQSPTTVLFWTTLRRMITLYKLLILLGSNHLQTVLLVVKSILNVDECDYLWLKKPRQTPNIIWAIPNTIDSFILKELVNVSLFLASCQIWERKTQNGRFIDMVNIQNIQEITNSLCFI